MSLQLFKTICPRTCANFKALCTGEAGECYPGVPMSYCNTKLHRIVVNGWIQGGGTYVLCNVCLYKGRQYIIMISQLTTALNVPCALRERGETSNYIHTYRTKTFIEYNFDQ